MNPLTAAAFQLGTLFPATVWLPGEAIEIRCLDASRPRTPPKARGFFTSHAEAITLTHPDRHPVERAPIANRVTARLLELRRQIQAGGR